jgi:hypothetical protein
MSFLGIGFKIGMMKLRIIYAVRGVRLWMLNATEAVIAISLRLTFGIIPH